MTAYRFTRQADKYLGDFYLYTAAQFRTRQADTYMDQLEQVFGLLASHPLRGRSAERIRPGLRRLEHDGHVISYRQAGEGVLIVGIIHRRMRPDLDPEG